MANLTLAFNYYAESEDVSRAVAIAQNPHSTQLISGIREPIARAIQLVPSDSLQSGHILANHGYCLGLTLDGFEAAQRAFDQSLFIARRHEDETLEMRVLANSGCINGYHQRWDDSLAKSLQALELTREIDEPHSKMLAHLWALHSLLNAVGDLERAKFHAEEMRTTAERLRDHIWLGRALNFQVDLSCLSGDWQAARDLSDHALGLFPMHPILLMQRALVEYQSGEFGIGRDYLERLLEARVPYEPGTAEYASTIVAIIPLVARITGVEEMFDVVQTDAEAFISSPYFHLGAISIARCALALMAVHLRDVRLADEQYAALVPYQGMVMYRLDLALDRVLGLLAQTMGNLDQAATHFEDAMTFCRNAGYRPELAWAGCDYADTLRERGADGDRAKAIALLDESLAISSELGMRPLMERVLSRREILNA